MDIHIKGAREHNLKNIEVHISGGLTVVTGISGSGKTSLVFDTLYHEAQRRFLDVYLFGRGGQRLSPAKVEEIRGLGPTIAVGQNLLNRNPLSTLASASGIHPFLRLFYTNFGTRYCLICGEAMQVSTEDEIIDQLTKLSQAGALLLYVPLTKQSLGSHKTLLTVLGDEFGIQRVLVDGKSWDSKPLNALDQHSIEIQIGTIGKSSPAKKVREMVESAFSLGSGGIRAAREDQELTLTSTLRCTNCGTGWRELRATHFNQKCPYCKGEGCGRCSETGMHPQAASVEWQGMRFPELLTFSVDQAINLFNEARLPDTAQRLKSELLRRLEALQQVGLGYISLDRPSPSLSRGESQRVRLAISLSSRLEDMLHVLDEPTIGQHPQDVARFLPAFRDLAGPVIFVEHDRMAAAAADNAVDIGPGAGVEGGSVSFAGPTAELWKADTPTGRYFSLQERVRVPEPRPETDQYLVIQQANKHNLEDINVRIPIGRLSVISGVSGSGKSTLIEHVLLPSLREKKPIGCEGIEGPLLKPVIVDQSPIGRNPRSNPATYTKLSDQIRDLFAEATGLSSSHFSFNRPEGACPECNGLGAQELKMRYLPSLWLPCPACDGQRFNPQVLSATVELAGKSLSIADVFQTPIKEIESLISETPWLSPARRSSAMRILKALNDIGLGYLELGQASPSLSGGEAQRVKLSKYLGKNNLQDQLLLLDEPSTGLHPQDLDGLLTILDRLVTHGATIVLIEHNTDLIRAADWIIDLGPGAGPAGGQLIYAGPLAGLVEVSESRTGQALLAEEAIQPVPGSREPEKYSSPVISIRNAQANNLKNVDVDIPKGTLTVITGVSGSGKSSLLQDVLQTEARHRYLESLSVYERQGIKESAEAQVDSISGLGVTLSVAPHQAHLWSQLPQFTRRNSVGATTEISFHLANLTAALGERRCTNCGTRMLRNEQWECPKCDETAKIAPPQHFSSSHWASSCKQCSGLGVQHEPQPEKLITHPEKPLCAGAMYSPGYWPQNYLCKDQPIIPEIGKQYGFDPFKTPWNEMPEEARQAFLFGDGRQYTWTYTSKGGRRKGQEHTSTWTWHGFYGEGSWVYTGDVHGTYTRQVACPACKGTGLRPEILAVTLQGRNTYELGEMPLVELEQLVDQIPQPGAELSYLATSLQVIRKRLRFLRQVGIGYLHLNRPTGTLSAGESQRIQLASLLGSGLNSLTILIDEPSRGMHPRELEALAAALKELREEGNTVIVVEHDLLLIEKADHIIDMGPGAGVDGGTILAEGTAEAIMGANTTTGKWLRKSYQHDGGETLWGSFKDKPAKVREPRGWITIRGARENNLRGEAVKIPLGVLTGICGVSGSGKSTLLIDTVGRALVKKSHSTSLAQEPVDPGEHDGIDNPPKRALVVDQTRGGIHSPAKFLGFEKPIQRLFAESDDAFALGLTEQELSKACSACRGRGVIRINMEFMPDEWMECETCKGSGYRQEAWEVRINGIALPEINSLTMDEVFELVGDHPLADRIGIVREVGLGYLVWRQPAYTLSGGEAQRLKIAKELMKKSVDETLYILDEPTLGLHLEDVAVLSSVLQQLVESGHTVVLIEHNSHLLAACDWLIELGPGGGPDGGKVIAEGAPRQVAGMDSPTAPYLEAVLGVR